MWTANKQSHSIAHTGALSRRLTILFMAIFFSSFSLLPFHIFSMGLNVIKIIIKKARQRGRDEMACLFSFFFLLLRLFY